MAPETAYYDHRDGRADRDDGRDKPPKDKPQTRQAIDVRQIERSLDAGRWVLLVPWTGPLHREAVMMAILRTALGISTGPQVDLLAAVEDK